MSCATADGGDTYAGDGASGLHLWGEQLEAGGFATSYIPTTSGAATRMMDIPIIAAGAVGAALNQGAGTIIVRCDFPKYNDAEPICIDDDSSANAIELYRKSATQLAAFITKDSIIQVDAAVVASPLGGTDITIHFQKNQVSIIDGAGSSNLDTSCEIPSNLKFIRIGHYRGLSKSINGHFDILKYFANLNNK